MPDFCFYALQHYSRSYSRSYYGIPELLTSNQLLTSKSKKNAERFAHVAHRGSLTLRHKRASIFTALYHCSIRDPRTRHTRLQPSRQATVRNVRIITLSLNRAPPAGQLGPSQRTVNWHSLLGSLLLQILSQTQLSRCTEVGLRFPRGRVSPSLPLDEVLRDAIHLLLVEDCLDDVILLIVALLVPLLVAVRISRGPCVCAQQSGTL